ncbi:hypothetical protein FGL91_18750 [Microbacterium sp. CBA3102]|uniref:hypothetical protein n=1 Tax=Microbacterium sp. CBA3102 TaxID=2603598 RepID=UPI0011BBD66D|nr:hypothetical protein [Microbacterium sp. CBA3102]QEA30407.1 hypothetical protein FGL91_18750 [Microbacterium sp. CBA3102]
MTDNTDREKLIWEAAKAMHGDDIDKGRAGDDYTSMNLETLDWYRDNARAALAVFEKAHTPTDDEREAWRDEAIRRYPHAEVAKYMRQALQNAFIEGAKFATGFRRTEVPEPSTEPDALCGDWPAPCNCDDPVTHDGSVPASIVQSERAEPSDAQVQAACRAWSANAHLRAGEAMRAALSAASSVTKGENRHG